MNYLNKLFSIFLLFFLFTNLSFSNEPVAYIDIDFILKNSDIGKKTLEKIKYALNNNLDKVEIFNIFNMALIIELEKTNFKDALVKMNSIYIDEEDFEKCAELQKIINKL